MTTSTSLEIQHLLCSFKDYPLFLSLNIFPASPKAYGTETAGNLQYLYFLLAPIFHWLNGHAQ